MGIEYSIFDKGRKEFISLHKWEIIDGVYEAIFEGTGTIPQVCIDGYPCAITSKPNLLKKISETEPEFDYIKKLAAYIPEAVVSWSDEKIYFCSDWSGEPWDYDSPTFCEWLELPGPEYFCSYLPRNLIHVHRCKIWADALPILDGHYLLHPQCKNELECIKRNFYLLLGSM